MRAAHARSDQSALYYPWFDWLRIVLASAVVLAHAGALPWHNAGNFAVQVFFALSGFLIGGILLSSDAGRLPRFYFHRALRIWFPYAGALVLLLAVSMLRDQVTPKYLELVFYKLTFVYNWFGMEQVAAYRSHMPLAGSGNHFWSICAE